MNGNGLSYLDRVWSAGGTRRLKRTFNDLALRDRMEALRQLNDEKLRFPVLFVLISDIGTHKMIDGLNQRNRTAVNICSRKIYKYDIETAAEDLTCSGERFQVLKWMFDTGKGWDGPSGGHDPYDAVIDYTVSLLIVEYDDKAVLKDVAALIFRRNRRGLFIHDLVWSFFQSLDGEALATLAGYLLSNDPRDAALAAKLLCLDTPSSNRSEARIIHRQFLDWCNENKPYLYLTGEHFQMTSKPRHLDADREAKYLGKEISPRYRAPAEPLTESEIECLRGYREASPDDQEALTEHSHRLRTRDVGLWQEWMRKQPAEQVAAVEMTREVIL